MTAIEAIENKISALRRYLAILHAQRDLTPDQLASEVMLRGAVERYLYLAAQSAIDLAEAVIAWRGLRKPSSFGEAFVVLQEAGMLSPPLAENLVRMAGIRNVLAHAYERVDYAMVCDVLENRLGDLEAFPVGVERSLA